MSKIIAYVPVYEKKRGELTTMAFIVYYGCGKTISTVGGPLRDALCPDCVQEWQPMSSSPKDGTEFLVYDTVYGYNVAAWVKEGKQYCLCVKLSEQDEQGGCMILMNPIKWKNLS